MRSHPPARLLQVIAGAGAIGLLLSASAALAQAAPGASQNVGQSESQTVVGPAANTGSGPEASPPGSVGGVVVQAPRRELDTTPPDKKAEYDKEAAKAEAWKRYRKSRPPTNASTLDQADDYPGLQSLVPH